MHIRDSFRNRFSLVDVPIVALFAYVTALFAWMAIIGRWLPMPGGAMDTRMRMSDPGVPEAMAVSNGITGAGLYLIMWG